MNKKQKPIDDPEDEEEPSVNRIASSFFESTSMHGVRRIYRKSGLCRRFVWLTVCLTFTVWAVSQICVVAYDYSQYPKKIDQRVEEDTVVHFPAVTLCSLNSMPHSEYLEEHKWWRAFVELEDQYIEPKCDSRKFTTKKKLFNMFKKQSNSRYKRAGDTGTGGSTQAYTVSPGGSTEGHSENSQGSTEGYDVSSRGYSENSVGSTQGFTMSSERSIEGHSENSPGSTEGYAMSSGSGGRTEGNAMSSGSGRSTEGNAMSSGSERSTEGYAMSSGSGRSTEGYAMISGSGRSTEGYAMSSGSGRSTEGYAMSSGSGRSTEGHSKYSLGSTTGYGMSSWGNTQGYYGNYLGSTDTYTTTYFTFNCSNTGKCNATCGGFPCSDGYCIPIYWECDDVNDCAGGEDESNCYTCPQGWYRCSSGKCISKQWLCDGWADCSDAADELMCGGDALVCPKGFFNCTDACIRDIFRCDGEVDCAAAEDEAECDECQSGALQCRGGSCVGAPRVCDGVRDCADGDDEDDCPANNSTALCPAGYLSCDNGTCYNGRFRCDGKMHCNDTTDEEDCYTELVTPEIHKARLRCSQYYRNLVEYLVMPEVANASLGDGQLECQHFKNGYTEFMETNQLCTTCGEISKNCWLPEWLDEYGFGKLSNDSLSLMLKKGELPDFTDIADLHASSREERLNNSVPAEDIVYSCTFDNHRCNHTQFFTWMSDEYGTCYTFNSFFQGNDSKVKTTKRAGPKTGLKVALEIRKGVALLTPEVGVRVVVHDPRLLPALEEEGFSIGPGVSSVAVKRTKYERLGNPHGVCANDYGFDHPYMYSRKLCKQLCIERVFREQCRCFIGQNPLYDSLETKPERQCSSSDRVQGLCMANVSKSIEEESIQCDCPLPCSEMTYDAQVTTSKPNNLYYNILSDTRKELKSLCSNDTQMVSLLVYLDSKSYGVTKESPAYSWDTLLSNIGGSLGLFIGVSLISILEMIEMIIDFVLIGFRRCTGRGKKISQMSATAWQGKMEVVERQMDRQDNRYEQLSKEVEMIKNIVHDLKQKNANPNESFSSLVVHPKSSADRGPLAADRVFSLLFLKDE